MHINLICAKPEGPISVADAGFRRLGVACCGANIVVDGGQRYPSARQFEQR
jgi:hypothetical protein